MRKTALILLIVLLIGVVYLEAQTSGRLSVRVRDTQGRTMEYVNVVVMSGSQRITGAQTNEKGHATIINIPPGFYTVKFTLVGYAAMTYQDVRIQVGQATNLSPVMNRQGIQTATIVVQANTDRVESGRTGSSHQIEMDRLTDSAVSDVEGIISLQAGVTNIGGELHVRGGRANEVNFTVDGMSVSDPVDGGSALSVDTDAIKDLKIMTGGFPAEFGNAQSGVINIVTKDGDPFFSGKIEYNTDHVIGEGKNMDLLKFAIGGPIVPFASQDLKERLTFYLNGAGEWTDGRYKDLYYSNPNQDYTFNGISILEADYPVYDPYKDRESFLGVDLGDRNYNTYNINLKTKYDLSQAQKLTFAIRGDKSDSNPFNPAGSYSWRYALQHYAYSNVMQQQYISTYDHMFSSSMNLKVKASYYTKDSEQGPRGIDRESFLYFPDYFDPNDLDALGDPLDKDNEYIDRVGQNRFGFISVDDNGDGIHDDGFYPSNYWQYRLATLEDPRSIPGFNPPGTIYTNFIDDTTTSINLRSDFEWQINETHLTKTGFELINHSIKKDQVLNFLTIYEDRRQAYLKSVYTLTEDDLNNFIADNTIPDELFSIKSKKDTPETIADISPIYKPMDYYNAAKSASGKRDGYTANPWQFAYYLQDKMEWEGMIVNAGMRFDFWYLGSSYKVLQDNGRFAERDFDKDDRFQMMVSPRLGVSHPITERDVLRFAYNYQNQLPQMQYIFTSKTPEDANLSDVAITVGNPNLEPQITVTYEVGLSHQLSDDYVLDMTAYYKNLYNYVSTIRERRVDEPSISWYRYISEDYGSARGIDIQLEKLLSNFNTWSIAYSLAWAQGNNSSTVIQDENTSLREFPLDWDVRHNASINYTFRVGRGEEFFIPFTDYILPLDDFSANINWSFVSGAPYTPQSIEGNSMLDTNSKRMDPTHQANARLTKGIQLPGGNSLRIFLDVENLFKTKNINSVYPKTGSPYDDGADLEDSTLQYTFPEVEFTYGKAVQNPAYIDNYRGITVGVSFNF
ncbi:MAG: carboxypeptidase regulatory-like domain-containing protein [Candidatus Cloacimonetes bacterium]|nr:carboxypeptidase regulatory-like domain-containing protein [Candidatus Cloacimonadota bacterium]MCK9333396.1 carboxypeptidase regulatory-like domain-containing protein [Candidatus Cloacimonadota bacterium]